MSLFRNHIIRSYIKSKRRPPVIVSIAESMPGDVCLYDKVLDKKCVEKL